MPCKFPFLAVVRAVPFAMSVPLPRLSPGIVTVKIVNDRVGVHFAQCSTFQEWRSPSEEKASITMSEQRVAIKSAGDFVRSVGRLSLSRQSLSRLCKEYGRQVWMTQA